MNLSWTRILSTLSGSLACLGLLAYFMQSNAMKPIDYYEPTATLPFGAAFCLWLSTRYGRHQPVSSLRQLFNKALWLILPLSLIMAFAQLDNLSGLGAALALLLLAPLYNLVLQLLLEPLQHPELTLDRLKASQRQWSSELGLYAVSACLAFAMMLFVMQYPPPASSEAAVPSENANDFENFFESELNAE